MERDSEKDPFSKAFDELWRLAENSPRLLALVRPGNRIKYNLVTDEPPGKEELNEGDLPELVLLVTQITGAIRANSSASKAILRYEWWLSTGRQGITNAVLPLAFTVYAAMTPWPQRGEGGALALTWRGKSFIKRIDLLDAQFGLQRSELNRGVGGWSCVWSCEVEMWFTTSDIVAALELESIEDNR